ncbi:MAG TPA: ATP synthase F1 subunit delta [Planctomycetaceae bacterium]|nr:ATP synthase F1 subunit delta [Planctomycetaceae bacterium]
MAEHKPDPTRTGSVMEDPSAQAIARTYADALLDASKATGTDTVLEELGSFVEDVLLKVSGLQEIFNSIIIGRDEKIRLIDNVIAPRASEIVTNFLRVLARHGRLDLLPAILREARIRNEIRQGRRRVQVTSARPLDSQAEGRIRSRLAGALPFEPILETHVDPSLLGGIVIRVGDTVYDSSLAMRIKQLRERLTQRSLHEIQSGRDRFGHPEGD